MDPEICIREILSLIVDLSMREDENAREMLVWHLDGLSKWIDGGGAIPHNVGADVDRYFVAR